MNVTNNILVEKRLSERKTFCVDAEVITSGILFPVSLENISRNGLRMVAPTDEVIEDFIPGATIGINFKTSDGDWISRQCKIRWLRIDTEPLVGLIYKIGLQLIAPLYQFNEVYTSLPEE